MCTAGMPASVVVHWVYKVEDGEGSTSSSSPKGEKHHYYICNFTDLNEFL